MNPDRDRALKQAFIERSRLLYEQDGNPLHIWNSIHGALVHRLEIPDWCREYLLTFSKAMIDIDASKFDAELKAAIGFDGNDVKAYREHVPVKPIWNCVIKHMQYGLRVGKAIEAAANELGMGKDNVHRAYYANKKKVDAMYKRHKAKTL